jgi:hypothetical protein
LAERRQLTIMFCDMVGSSALSTRLDPEEQRDVVSSFQSCCANEVKRLGGMVAQYLGDGVLSYFGYPAAHEDDAERAVQAGLTILKTVPALEPAAGVSLEARIGVATGVVVVGDLVREDVTQELCSYRRDDEPSSPSPTRSSSRRQHIASSVRSSTIVISGNAPLRALPSQFMSVRCSDQVRLKAGSRPGIVRHLAAARSWGGA